MGLGFSFFAVPRVFVLVYSLGFTENFFKTFRFLCSFGIEKCPLSEALMQLLSSGSKFYSFEQLFRWMEEILHLLGPPRKFMIIGDRLYEVAQGFLHPQSLVFRSLPLPRPLVSVLVVIARLIILPLYTVKVIWMQHCKKGPVFWRFP